MCEGHGEVDLVVVWKVLGAIAGLVLAPQAHLARSSLTCFHTVSVGTGPDREVDREE